VTDLRLLWLVAFLVGALVVDQFVSWSPLTRSRLRAVVLIVGIIWVLVLAGVLIWRGF
jgi:hypothetical protein